MVCEGRREEKMCGLVDVSVVLLRFGKEVWMSWWRIIFFSFFEISRVFLSWTAERTDDTE